MGTDAQKISITAEILESLIIQMVRQKTSRSSRRHDQKNHAGGFAFIFEFFVLCYYAMKNISGDCLLNLLMNIEKIFIKPGKKSSLRKKIRFSFFDNPGPFPPENDDNPMDHLSVIHRPKPTDSLGFVSDERCRQYRR